MGDQVEYFVRTRSGDKGPFTLENLQKLFQSEQLPESAQIVSSRGGPPVSLLSLLLNPERQGRDEDSVPEPRSKAPLKTAPAPRHRPLRAHRTAVPRRPGNASRLHARRRRAPRPVHRPGVVTALAAYDLLVGVLCIILVLLFGYFRFVGMKADRPDWSFADANSMLSTTAWLCGLALIYAAAFVVAGMGLWRLRPWAYTMTMVLSIVGVLHLNPLAIPGLVCVFRKDFRQAFSDSVSNGRSVT